MNRLLSPAFTPAFAWISLTSSSALLLTHVFGLSVRASAAALVAGGVVGTIWTWSVLWSFPMAFVAVKETVARRQRGLLLLGVCAVNLLTASVLSP